MKSHFNRRDFLKLAGLSPLSLLTPNWLKMLGSSQPAQTGQKYVVVIVFDALSAHNISLYGYQRETMPNLSRLAKRAIVYHNHYASGNFTTPGTASLLTGTLPWTHRALEYKGTVVETFVTRNIFSAFHDYYRIAYTHNPLADTLLEQFKASLDEWIPWKKLFLNSDDGLLQTWFKNDNDIASVSWTRNMNIKQEGYAYSLFFSHLYEALQKNKYAGLKKLFPRGLPSTGSVNSEFILETAIDWIENRILKIRQPFVGYFHFLPPHLPYNTPLQFYNHFNGDGYMPVNKPDDIFSEQFSDKALLKMRTEYDEFILYADAQFGRFFDALETSGVLENTWVVFTSDHGEMFERGISGHSSDALYQPVVRVPLLIFEPGRTTGMDIHTPTSAIDVLPTLLHVTGKHVPDWIEGMVLAPFSTAESNPDQNVYVVRANKNGKYAPLTRASMALIKGRYKLLFYFGYAEHDVDELLKLYDIEADPEELVDLVSTQPEIAAGLLGELKAKLAEVDKPYIK